MTEEEADRAVVAALCRQAENDPALACTIGDHYRLGSDGFPVDPRRAFLWYARSALGGHAKGQCNLGVCYEIGFGCHESPSRCFHWYARAALQGLATAIGNVGLCYLFGRGVPVDVELAKRWLQRAVEEGDRKVSKHLAYIPGGVTAWDPVMFDREELDS
jgi:TPR repeat protein